MQWSVRLTGEARKQLAHIRDARVRAKLREALAGLAEDPDRKGKPLTGNLKGFRSIQAVGQRYRIIYKLEQDTVTVYIVTVALRKVGDTKDAYALAQRLLRLGLLDPEPE